MKVGINSNDDPPLEKTINTQNTIIFIETIFSNNYNHYHHGVCLTKCSYK